MERIIDSERIPTRTTPSQRSGTNRRDRPRPGRARRRAQGETTRTKEARRCEQRRAAQARGGRGSRVRKRERGREEARAPRDEASAKKVEVVHVRKHGEQNRSRTARGVSMGIT